MQLRGTVKYFAGYNTKYLSSHDNGAKTMHFRKIAIGFISPCFTDPDKSHLNQEKRLPMKNMQEFLFFVP